MVPRLLWFGADFYVHMCEKVAFLTFRLFSNFIVQNCKCKNWMQFTCVWFEARGKKIRTRMRLLKWTNWIGGIFFCEPHFIACYYGSGRSVIILGEKKPCTHVCMRHLITLLFTNKIWLQRCSLEHMLLLVVECLKTRL